MINRATLDPAYGSNVLCVGNDKKAFKYEGDKRTDICEGWNLPCVFPKLGFEKANIRISKVDREPLYPDGVEVPEDGAKVVFDNLKIECYRPQNGFGLAIAASADGVRLDNGSASASKPTASATTPTATDKAAK